MIKTYYLAKILFKLRIPSFDKCKIDKTSNVSYDSVIVRTQMGRYSYIGAKTCVTDAQIGNFCCIAGDCDIGGGVHPTDTVSMSPVFFKGKNFLRKNFANINRDKSNTVIIGNDVWIGEGAYIKSGVKIGDGAVIGAHSVVTHNVQAFTVVAGVPAREIRKRFNDDIIDKLLKIKWWNWSDEKLYKYGKYFESPEKLICVTEENI